MRAWLSNRPYLLWYIAFVVTVEAIVVIFRV